LPATLDLQEKQNTSTAMTLLKQNELEGPDQYAEQAGRTIKPTRYRALARRTTHQKQAYCGADLLRKPVENLHEREDQSLSRHLPAAKGTEELSTSSRTDAGATRR